MNSISIPVIIIHQLTESRSGSKEKNTYVLMSMSCNTCTWAAASDAAKDSKGENPRELLYWLTFSTIDVMSLWSLRRRVTMVAISILWCINWAFGRVIQCKVQWMLKGFVLQPRTGVVRWWWLLSYQAWVDPVHTVSTWSVHTVFITKFLSYNLHLGLNLLQ